MKKILYLASALVAVSCYGSTAYVTDGAGQFGTMDLGTGVFNQIGGEEPSLLYGLGWEGGVLYGLDTNSDPNLVTIDPITGAINTVGATGLAPRSILSAISGGSLYALDGVTSDLYSISAVHGSRNSRRIHKPARQPWFQLRFHGRRHGEFIRQRKPDPLHCEPGKNGNTTVVGSLPNSLVLGAAAMDNQLYAVIQRGAAWASQLLHCRYRKRSRDLRRRRPGGRVFCGFGCSRARHRIPARLGVGRGGCGAAAGHRQILNLRRLRGPFDDRLFACVSPAPGTSICRLKWVYTFNDGKPETNSGKLQSSRRDP